MAYRIFFSWAIDYLLAIPNRFPDHHCLDHSSNYTWTARVTSMACHEGQRGWSIGSSLRAQRERVKRPIHYQRICRHQGHRSHHATRRIQRSFHHGRRPQFPSRCTCVRQPNVPANLWNQPHHILCCNYLRAKYRVDSFHIPYSCCSKRHRVLPRIMDRRIHHWEVWSSFAHVVRCSRNVGVHDHSCWNHFTSIIRNRYHSSSFLVRFQHILRRWLARHDLAIPRRNRAAEDSCSSQCPRNQVSFFVWYSIQHHK